MSLRRDDRVHLLSIVELFGDEVVAAPTTAPHPHNGAIAKKIRNPRKHRFELEIIRFDRSDREL